MQDKKDDIIKALSLKVQELESENAKLKSDYNECAKAKEELYTHIDGETMEILMLYRFTESIGQVEQMIDFAYKRAISSKDMDDIKVASNILDYYYYSDTGNNEPRSKELRRLMKEVQGTGENV